VPVEPITMKFDPVSKRLYTNDNVFLKQLHCPYRMSWENLQPKSDERLRLCEVCERRIIDTIELNDEEVLTLVTKDPASCLRVSLNQENLRVFCSNDAH
jgi:hypothetical protein